MRFWRRGFTASCVAWCAVLAAAVPAGADTATFEDDVNDVISFETGDTVSEPRVDLTEVRVEHEAQRLVVELRVVQAVDADSPVWTDSELQIGVALADPEPQGQIDAGVWFWTLVVEAGEAHAELLELSFFEETEPCLTDAVIDTTANSYTFSTDAECLRGIPRSLEVQGATAFDSMPSDESFDFLYDEAPDGDFSEPVASTGLPPIARLAGPDRIETAIALSADRFELGGAPAAVLASSADYPDAIAGGPLAAREGGPLLLSGRDGLDPRTADEIARAVELGSPVYLLGGTAALGSGVESAIRSLGYRPVRLAGANRFETAVAIAEAMPEHDVVVIADGSRFDEGLVAGAAAASINGIVLLTDGDHLPAATDDFLANDPHRHLAIGRAAAAAPGAERIIAKSTAELSQKVLDRLLPKVATIAVASTRSYADALAGAPHIASLGGGLLLTGVEELATEIEAELGQRAGDLRGVVLYGGTASLSESVASAIESALSAAPAG